MNINFDLKIESEMDMEDVAEKIKECENKLLSVEEFQNLKQLYLVKSLMEKCEIKDELLKEAEGNNILLRRKVEEFSKLIKRQSDELKLTKQLLKTKTAEVEKLKAEFEVLKMEMKEDDVF